MSYAMPSAACGWNDPRGAQSRTSTTSASSTADASATRLDTRDATRSHTPSMSDDRQDAPTVVLDQPWYDSTAQCTALYRGLWHDNQPCSHGVALYTNDATGDTAPRRNQPAGCDWKLYEGCWSSHHTGHFEGHGRLVYTNDDVYTGSFVASQRHGQGTYQWSDGRRTYTGSWRHNQRTGYGIYTYQTVTNGTTHGTSTTTTTDYYKGEFVHGQRSGRGTFVFGATGASYTGEWHQGLYHGHGRTVDELGHVYTGQFHQGHAVVQCGSDNADTDADDDAALEAVPDATSDASHENDTLMVKALPPTAAPPPPPPLDVSVVVDYLTTDTLSCPGHYTGMVVPAAPEATTGSPSLFATRHTIPPSRLVPHGVGRMVYSDQSRIHEGFWVHGAKQGHGRCWFVPQHDVHEGDYHGNVRHGPGTYTWADGRHYTGDYECDERHGHGVFTYPNGERYQGMFRKGVRSGVGRLDFVDSGLVSPLTTGTFMGPVPPSHASSLHSMGYYDGEWHEGKYHGTGCIVWNSIGQSYTGEFALGQLHGTGRLTQMDGTGTSHIVTQGQWVHGVFQSEPDAPCESNVEQTEAPSTQDDTVLERGTTIEHDDAAETLTSGVASLMLSSDAENQPETS